jgi:hypothetical protein
MLKDSFINSEVHRYIGSEYMNNIDLKEWRLKRAKGAIEEYLRGVKKRAADIEWVMGVLKGSFGVSKKETLELIEQIKNDVTFLMTPERFERLNKLIKRIEAEEW